jgi:hypothetical protein
MHLQVRRHFYDREGKPTSSLTIDRTFHLIGPFTEGGGDTKEAFRKYQESMGQSYEP